MTDKIRKRSASGALVVAALLLAACSRPAPGPAASAEAPSPQSDYLASPEPRSATATAGGVMLAGVGQPDATIRLASPDGSAIGAAAGHDGAWSLTAPGGDTIRLYSLSEDLGGRLLRARGYVALVPQPGPAAATLHPGTAVEPLGPRPAGLRIAAVDFDRSGAAVASGSARPLTSVRITLDGAEAGEDRTDAAGRYAVTLAETLRPGRHVLAATSPGSPAASAAFDAAPAAPIARPPFTAARQDGAWRLDWMTPGGGVQTTVMFDPEEARG